MSKSICITGANGFVGRHMVKYFTEKGNAIIEIDKTNNIDMLDDQLIAKIRRFDILIHLAANTYVPDSYENPVKFFKYNYLLTLAALELCRKFQAHFIFFSSYIYGKPRYIPIDENHPIDGFNPYAHSKIICEELCQAYNRHFQIPLTIVRPFNIYGPGQDERFLISKIIKMAKEEGDVLLDDPFPRRDYIYIEDVLTFTDLLIQNCGHSFFDLFNLGTGKDYSVQEIISMISEEMHFSYNFTNKIRTNEINLTKCDVSKAKNILNWEPKISMKQGLKEIINASKE